MENESNFAELFSKYMEVVTQLGVTQGDELNNRFQQLIFDQKVAPAEVVQALTDAFSHYSDHKLFLLLIMSDIVITSKMSGGYIYPEFFWIAVRSNIIFETANINDIMTALVNFSNTETIRAFLTYQLITGNETERRSAVFAFYYTGFTADTLKLVTELVPTADVKLYGYIYSTAMSTMFSNRAKDFSEDEERYFRSFFELGADSEDPDIAKNSRTALKQLEIL